MSALVTALLNGKAVDLGIATIETVKMLASLLKRPKRESPDGAQDVPLEVTLAEIDAAMAPFERIEDAAKGELDKLGEQG